MIFYIVEPADRPFFLVATQADAKREARELKCTWSQEDVPTDKAGLMAFLNVMLANPLGDGTNHDAPIPAEPAPTAPVPTSPVSYTPLDVVDFILNVASVPQVENIMAAIGTRFAELVKAQR